MPGVSPLSPPARDRPRNGFVHRLQADRELGFRHHALQLRDGCRDGSNPQSAVFFQSRRKSPCARATEVARKLLFSSIMRSTHRPASVQLRTGCPTGHTSAIIAMHTGRFSFIKGWCNLNRRHQDPGRQSPMVFERRIRNLHETQVLDCPLTWGHSCPRGGSIPPIGYRTATAP